MAAEHAIYTGISCACKPGAQRDNCPACEGTGKALDFRAIRAAKAKPQHEHAAKHVSVMNSGTVHEVCLCGATRFYGVEQVNDKGGWHACRLCVVGA